MVITGNGANGGPPRNGSLLFQKIPWGVLLPILVGWIGLGITFYTSTNAQLAEHQKQLNSITQSRERLVEQYTARLDKLTEELHAFVTRVDRLETPLGKKVEGMQNLMSAMGDRINALSNNLNTSQVTETTRFEQMQRQIDALNKRDDQMLQALDAQYNALNEHLRSHGGGSPPPRR